MRAVQNVLGEDDFFVSWGSAAKVGNRADSDQLLAMLADGFLQVDHQPVLSQLEGN